MPAVGTPSNVKVGPGVLYFAPLGTEEPDDLTTAWAAGWVKAGYTDEGHTVTYSPSFESLEVAEENVPLRYELSSAEYTVEFSLAELTIDNIQKAFNGGTITTADDVKTYIPPAASAAATRIMIGFQSQDGTERWVYRKCLQTGDVEIARRKAPDKSLIPMSFMLEVPSDGGAPFIGIFPDEA